MNGPQIVIKSLNPITLTFGIASVAAGCAAAAIYGYVAYTPSVLCLIFAIFAQCAGNIAHRYYDEKYGLGENLRDGMSFEDEDGRPIIYVLWEGVKVSTFFTLACGVAILMIAGWWTIIPGLLILAINWLNNKGKHPWSHGLLYPLITFLIFGPLCVISTFFVIINYLHVELEGWQELYPAIVMSIVMGFLTMNSHMIDRATNTLSGFKGHTTFTGKYGLKVTSTILTFTTIVYSAVFIFAPVEMQIYFTYSFIILPVVSFLISCISIYLLCTRKNPYNAWILSVLNILLVGIATLIIFWFGGFPNLAEIDAADIPTLL